MSRLKMEAIWQHDKVLPYILGELKQKIDNITPVHAMYLTGSRCRIPATEWHSLQGKDWDILAVCNFRIINTRIWTEVLNYHIDLVIVNENAASSLLRNAVNPIQLYPINQLILDN